MGYARRRSGDGDGDGGIGARVGCVAADLEGGGGEGRVRVKGELVEAGWWTRSVDDGDRETPSALPCCFR
eukprot:3754069-Pyramimonas_sp.AAC.1